MNLKTLFPKVAAVVALCAIVWVLTSFQVSPSDAQASNWGGGGFPGYFNWGGGGFPGYWGGNWGGNWGGGGFPGYFWWW